MHQLILEHKSGIDELCRRYNVSRLEVFGSAARATDFDLDRSDADFMVEFFKPSKLLPLEEYMGFRDELVQLLGRSVDLIETQVVRNPYLRKSIDENRELVFAA